MDDCVVALIDDARAPGAIFREHEAVVEVRPTANAVAVRTARDEYHASRLVLTAGPWAAQVLPQAGVSLTVMRQIVFWFDVPDRSRFERPQFPVFMADTPEGCFYGIPATSDHGLKLARHYGAAELSGPE